MLHTLTWPLPLTPVLEVIGLEYSVRGLFCFIWVVVETVAGAGAGAFTGET